MNYSPRTDGVTIVVKTKNVLTVRTDRDEPTIFLCDPVLPPKLSACKMLNFRGLKIYVGVSGCQPAFIYYTLKEYCYLMNLQAYFNRQLNYIHYVK